MAVIGDYLSMKVNMGGSTGEALSKARDYRKEKFGKLYRDCLERQKSDTAVCRYKLISALVAGLNSFLDSA